MKLTKRLPCLIFLICISLSTETLLAQAGTSSMSVSVGKAGIHRTGSRGQYIMPSPDMFRVEEFVNYHRHDLPLPSGDERVRLEVQNLRLENGKTVYQFGITTPRAIDPEKVPPLNIVLVIDRSGSMQGAKMANVKKAIHEMVDKFRKSDRISIVSFSNDASLDLPASDKTKKKKISKAIDCIDAMGGTNLHAGLMLGFQTAMKNFDPERTNRVIFLTDGHANVGTTDVDQIARESKAYNAEGISLTTIGLGQTFNHDLLRKLADAGNGLAHFVGDDKDIEKTFVAEVDSLLAPAARKVRLSLNFRGLNGTPKFYGYELQRKSDDDQFVFELDDLNHGATQVVMARLPSSHVQTGTATLSYVDAITNKKVSTSCDLLDIETRKGGRKSVRRNYAIALVAKGIQKAAEASNEGECAKAEKKLKKAIEMACDVCDNDDKHLRRVVKIAGKYRTKIHDSIHRMAVKD